MIKLFGLLIVFIFFNLAHALEQNYSMEDLEALEASKNYKEFFLHARDIRPAQRHSYWKKIVNNMAQGWFQALNKAHYLDDDEASQAIKVGFWPELIGDDVFKERRDRLATKYFLQCPSKDDKRKQCIGMLTEYWSLGGTPEVLAKLIPVVDQLEEKEALIGQSLPFRAWDFFLPLAKSDLAEFYCHKPPYDDLIWQNIVVKNNNEKDIDELHKDCWNKFRPIFLERWPSSSPDIFEKSLQIMTKKNELQGDLAEWPYFFYLLKGKWGNSELSLLSLEKLSSLSHRPQVRENILKKIEDIPFIPDELFAEEAPSNKKNEFLQRALENFPEFFDLYAKNCLDYLEGKRKFKNGNPTLHCREIFTWTKNSKLKKVFSEQAWNRFNKISI